MNNTPTQNQDKDRAEIARLRSTSPLYDLFRHEWDFNLSAYEGGQQFITKDNLFKHNREHEDDYKERLKRAHYMNYCEPLVDFFTDFIFAETIQRHGGSNTAFYNNFIADVNNKGDDITSFMEEASDDMQILGETYILVDAPSIPDGTTLTKAQEQKLNIRPYWVAIRPQEVLDWVVDPFERFQYLKRQLLTSVYSPSGTKHLERYTEWTPTKITITDVDVTNPQKPILMPAVELSNNIGQVPIIKIRYKKSKTYKEMGVAFLKDLAANNREVMNLTSLLQEFLYRQCFNILAVQTDQQLPIKEQSEGEQGTANFLQYPKGAEKPSYIAPSSDPADKLHEERQTIINEMYKRAAQDTVNELFNGVKSSGFSKAQSFSTTVPRIASRAETLEKAENALMSLTMLYMGKTWDGKVKYKDRYELTNISDALSQMTQLFKDLQMPSETFCKQQLKRMVHEFDGKIPSEDMDKIEAEIDAMNFKEWQDTQKLAFIGKAALSPEIGLAFGDSSKPNDFVKPGSAPAGNSHNTVKAAATPIRKPSTSAEIKAESTKRGKG